MADAASPHAGVVDVPSAPSHDHGRRVPPSATARFATLRREIDDHNRSYYVDDSPTISDAEYDALFQELEALEARYPDLATADSPTRKIGAAARTDFAPVRHAVPMLSIRTETDTVAGAAAKFDARLRRDLALAADAPPVEYLAELKFDGLAISLRYDDGRLTVAATRGDEHRGTQHCCMPHLARSEQRTYRQMSATHSIAPAQPLRCTEQHASSYAPFTCVADSL